MRHSVLLRVGENLIYQQAPNEKPRQESSASQVEYNRALPEWEHTAKNYLIKKEDAPAFIGQLTDEQKEKLITGLPVEPSVIEVYEDSFKKFARKKGASTEPIKTKTEAPVKTQTNEEAPKSLPKKQIFAFELNIDDVSGEPTIIFPFKELEDSIEKKLLKSFIIKGIKSGIEIKAEGWDKVIISVQN